MYRRPESSVEKAATQGAEKLGVPSLKLGLHGWPDRLFLLPRGRPLFVEFKRDIASIVPLRQRLRQSGLRSLGYEVWLVWDAGSFLEQLRFRLDESNMDSA